MIQAFPPILMEVNKNWVPSIIVTFQTKPLFHSAQCWRCSYVVVTFASCGDLVLVFMLSHGLDVALTEHSALYQQIVHVMSHGFRDLFLLKILYVGFWPDKTCEQIWFRSKKPRKTSKVSAFSLRPQGHYTPTKRIQSSRLVNSEFSELLFTHSYLEIHLVKITINNHRLGIGTCCWWKKSCTTWDV